jgi:hypothetical protein
LTLCVFIGYTYFKPKTVDSKINELQDLIDKNKSDEQVEQIRKLKLQQLQNPEIINKELTKVGKLLVYQGTTEYSDIIKESNFWGSKTLDLHLYYNFGISIELQKIIVDRFYDKTVVLNIPKQELQLEYIEMDTTKSKVNGEKKWFNSNYKPDEVDMILVNAQEKTRNTIINDKDSFDTAADNLKAYLKDFVLKLGYDDVIFN